MTIEQLTFLRHYLSMRGTGKTTLQQMGTLNYDRKFAHICDSRQYHHGITRNPNSMYVNVNNLDVLRGHNMPILIDDTVILRMIEELISLKMSPPRTQYVVGTDIIGVKEIVSDSLISQLDEKLKDLK